jgi:hypothetical protein
MLDTPNSLIVTALRKKSLHTLHESIELFEKAFSLLSDGAEAEAEQLKEQAKAKRSEAAWLDREATRLESIEAGKLKLNAN